MSFLSLAFDTGARRRPQGRVGQGIKVFAAAVTVWSVYAAAYSHIDVLALTITFLGLMLVLTFLTLAPTAESLRDEIPWFDWILAIAGGVCGLYFLWQANVIARRITLLDPLSPADILFATLIVLLTLEAMRRTVGLGLTTIVLMFIFYNLFGDLFSGPLSHGEISFLHFLDITVFTTDGLFGVPLRVAATYAFLFVIFGTALAKTGGSDFFFNFAAALTGGTPGGPAKIAVISSGLYGTISGSPTSDVVATGSITIPMMKRMGYSAAFAGAIEVAASTGGSLVPPVMGAAAFIMAEYTGISYVEIAFAALIPSLLYYVPIYLQVHLQAERHHLPGIPRETIPPLRKTLREGAVFFVPLVAVTWALVEGYSPTYAAIYAIMAVAAVAMLRRETRPTPAIIYEILWESSLRIVGVAGACAAAGLVIGGITMTGLASKFGSLIFLLSGANVFMSMVFAAMLTIVLGCGMPTPSAYILAAVLVSPTLVTLGIDTMAGHLFLLYFACMSALTPPVAVAAYAASAIADENPLKIAVASVRIALGAFLVPFCFVYNRALLLDGSVFDIIYATTCATVGLALVAVATEGYWRRPLHAASRAMLAGAGLLFLFVDPLPVAIAAAVGVAAALLQWRAGQPAAAREG
jgi:TRAP transporter 4TM/12TM fusion protein